MADTTFVTGTTITSTWLNDINDTVYNSTQNISGSTPRDIRDKLTDVVSVKDFGAVGDGVTDDTTSINTAILNNTGKTLYFPAGVYIYSNTSFVDLVINLVGEHKNTTSIKWKDSSAESNLFDITGTVNLQVTNLTLDSNRQNQTDSRGYYGFIGGILEDASEIVLDNCSFINGRITDIVLIGPEDLDTYCEVSINKCKFYDGLVGTSTRAAQAISISEGVRVSLTNCVFKQPIGPTIYGRGGFIMQRPAGSTSLSWGQLVATGNTFENFGRQTLNRQGCIYVYSGSELTTIIGNKFKKSYGTAITVKADCGPTTIIGNVVNGHTDAASAAICLFGQADSYTSSIGLDFVVSGNSIYNAELTSIFFDGSRNGLSDASSYKITGNICDGGVRGIHFKNLNNTSIVDNIIRNTTGIGLFGESCSNDIILMGNNINASVVGIDINGTTSSARFNISENSLSSLTGAAIRIRTPVESFIIEDNKIAVCTSAFDTRGATQLSTIRKNTVRGETTVWDKSGTYGTLVFENNITTIAAAFTSVRQLIIASGVVTAYADWHWIETEATSATDDLDTINGGYEGKRLLLFAANNGRDVVLKDATGNLRLNGDFTLTHADDCIELCYRNSVWVEISRSDNTA